MINTENSQEKVRCGWCTSDPVYIRYHDREWGIPVHNDRRLYEFLVLEGAQAGLNWITVLKKRPAYRAAFDQFDFRKVARYNDSKIGRLLADPGIIRNRLKIRSAVQNARAILRIRDEFGTFNRFVWAYVDHEPVINHWRNLREVPATTPVSDMLSRDLKRRGFSFVGSTICYAYMQAVGMVNDHTMDCFRHGQTEK